MKNITVRDVYLASTKAMFQFAVDQGLLAENPAKEVKVRVKKKVKEREKGFDGDEAAKILAASQGPFSHLISVETKAARRWLPWIARLEMAVHRAVFGVGSIAQTRSIFDGAVGIGF